MMKVLIAMMISVIVKRIISMMKPKVIAFKADNINTIDNEGDAE